MTSDIDRHGLALNIYISKQIPLIKVADIPDIIRDQQNLLRYADLISELDAMGMGFIELGYGLSRLFQTTDAEERGCYQAALIGIVAGLCPHEMQLKVIKSTGDYLENNKYRNISKNLRSSRKIGISKVDLSFLGYDHENYIALYKCFGNLISSEEFAEKVLIDDDVYLYSLLTRGSRERTGYYINQSTITTLLSDVQYRFAVKVINAHFCTRTFTCKDLFAQLLPPFSDSYIPRDSVINPVDIDKALLARHGQMILLNGFQAVLNNDFLRNETPSHPEEQANAIKEVMDAMIAAGVDWYAPWISTRSDQPQGALIDLQGQSFTLHQQVSGFFSDPRVSRLKKDSMEEILLKGVARSLPAEVIIEIFDQSDNNLDFFYRMTGNTLFVEQIKNREIKRKIIERDLGM